MWQEGISGVHLDSHSQALHNIMKSSKVHQAEEIRVELSQSLLGGDCLDGASLRISGVVDEVVDLSAAQIIFNRGSV